MDSLCTQQFGSIHQKKEMEAKAFVFNAELQWQQSNGSPVLLEHYFS